MSPAPPPGRADLHLHTVASDGAFSPEALVGYALDAALGAIGVTDHDTLGSVAACTEAARGTGLEVVPGVELSCREDSGREFHVVGLFVDPGSEELREALGHLRDERRRRIYRMAEAFRRAGIALDPEAVFAVAGEAAPGRPHVARALQAGGWVATLQQAFAWYIGDSGPCYVPHETFPLEAGVALVRGAGGVPVLAHPGASRMQCWEGAVAESGLAGIEVYSPKHTPAQEAVYLAMAESEGLLVSGGSDAHGLDGTRPGPGDRWVTYETYVRIRERAEQRG
jgi:predicted metal-dependent phosphoesterase TrpH